MKSTKQKLLDYLKGLKFMSVSTYDTHLWTAWVYYTIDENFNLYFISQPDTDHCKSILKNGEIACAIADSHQNVTDKKVGAQLYGVACQLLNNREIQKVLKLWHKANPGFEKIINLKNMQNKTIKSGVFKVTPKKIKWYNEALYTDKEFEIFLFTKRER